MATGNGEWQGNWIDIGSQAYMYVNVSNASFNESTGNTSIHIRMGIYVYSGNFYGTTFRRWQAGGYDDPSDSVSVYGAGAYATTEWDTDVAYGSNIHFVEGCGYYSGTYGLLQSNLDFYWYPDTHTYTVSYDANGGVNAPTAQSKEWGTTLTLSSSIPTRTGYTFKGWGTSSGATAASYQAGGSYTANANQTLYAIWEVNTYTIEFDGNGNTSGSTDSMSMTYGVEQALTANGFVKTASSFLGWSNVKNSVLDYGSDLSKATGTKYTDKQSISNLTSVNGETITLYAVWSVAYVAPTVEITKCYRSNISGYNDDDGTYATIYVTYAANKSIDKDNIIKSLTVYYREYGATDWTIATASAPEESSGTKQIILSNITFSTEVQYEVQVTVADSYGETLSVTNTASDTDYISKAFFTMDFLAGGKGVAFGAPSTKEGFTCAMESEFTKSMNMGDSTGKHLEIDINTIQAKTDSSTAAPLHLNDDGGDVYVNGNKILTIDNIYPVGSIYMSVNSTSPETLFGGTWEQLKDRFLLGAGDTYNAGSTDGNANHAHTMNFLGTQQYATNSWGLHIVQPSDIDGVSNETFSTSSESNMPPYLAVYMWKRTK